MRPLPRDPARFPSPEDRVIPLVARTELAPARREALRGLLSRPLRWDRLLPQARRAGVLPLLSHHLRQDPAIRALAPARVRLALEEVRYQTVGRNLCLFQALQEVLHGFASRGIPVIPLKGAYLIPEVYRRFDVRTASDLDLLVRREDLRRIDSTLKGLGYVAHREVRRFFDPKRDPTVTFAFYRRPGEPRYFLDLRWHLSEIPACQALGLFPVEMERVWSESEEWSCEGEPARSLSPAHHLLYLALHALKHAFDPVLFLGDIGEFWDWGRRGPEARLSIPRLREEAVRFGLVRVLDLALRLSREIVGAAIPRSILAGLTPGRFSPLERIFLRSVLSGRRAPGAPYLIYLDLLEGFRRRASLVGQTFFPQPEAIFWADEDTLGEMGLFPRIRRAMRGARMTLDIFR